MAGFDPFDATLLEGLAALTLDEVRARRQGCQDVETQVSYVRRLAQGRLDIVRHEQARRVSGGASGDIVAELTEALADRITSAGSGHVAAELTPDDVDPALLDALDAAAPPAALSDPHNLGDDDLVAAAAGLEAFEQNLSTRRRALFSRIDALQEEIVRRYRDGEASVDGLLAHGTGA